MKRLKFVKDTPGIRWYIDLPWWEGSRAELEMVDGADTMLNILSEGNSEVVLYVSENEFEGSDKVEMIRLATEYGNGAFYKLDNYKGKQLNLEMWLCDVTKFVFGDFPNKFFISTEIS